jgi:hypothetical protein
MPDGTEIAPRKLIKMKDAAKALGVTRQHLSYVLHGHRRSPTLLQRYDELVRKIQQEFESRHLQ